MTLTSYSILLSSTVGITPAITTDGTNTAGEAYILVCSVAASLDLTITWLDPMSNVVPSAEMVTTMNTITSTLTFNPLSASHAGTYTCKVTANGQMQTTSEMVTVESE